MKRQCDLCGGAGCDNQMNDCQRCAGTGYLGSDEPFVYQNQRVFTHERWDALLEDAVAQIKKLSTLKGGEYAGDTDRLANFRRNGERLGLPMETVWAVYAGKHWDAISQYIMDQRNGVVRERLEGIDGRVDDLLVYLLLFKAMLQEKAQ